MEHVKRLILAPEHIASKKTLVPPLNSQVKELDSEMGNVLDRQDISADEKVKMYDQTFQRFLNYYDKRMNKPVRVDVVKPEDTQPIDVQQAEPFETPDEVENDIIESVPATMQSRARQLVKKLKENKEFVRWNDQGQMIFKGRTIPGTNIVDLVNDTLRQRKNFNPPGWELFSKALGNLNVPESIVRNAKRLKIVKEYKTKDIRNTEPQTEPVEIQRTPVAMKTRRKRRKINASPFKWLT